MYIGIFYFRQTSRYCNEMNAKTSDFYSYFIYSYSRNGKSNMPFTCSLLYSHLA